MSATTATTASTTEPTTPPRRRALQAVVATAAADWARVDSACSRLLGTARSRERPDAESPLGDDAPALVRARALFAWVVWGEWALVERACLSLLATARKRRAN